MLDIKLGFIGTGNMAQALIVGILGSKLISNKNIIACDRHNETLIKVKDNHNINVHCNNKEIVSLSDIIFICVKPQDIDHVLQEIKEIAEDKLFVSIAAGITLATLQMNLKKVIRVMPNAPCLVGESACAYSLGKNITEQDEKKIRQILQSSGIALKVNEKHLDAVTALSGSGPAYFAYFIEGLAKEAIKLGLDHDIAFKLASQTAMGTGKLLLDKNISPKQLIQMVTSPGGTTEAGMKVLNSPETKKILQRTIQSAYKKSMELR